MTLLEVASLTPERSMTENAAILQAFNVLERESQLWSKPVLDQREVGKVIFVRVIIFISLQDHQQYWRDSWGGMALKFGWAKGCIPERDQAAQADCF
jgi:hypothetical protein